MERIIHMQMHSYLKNYNLLSKAYLGFRKNHSKETCIDKLTDLLYSNMKEDKITGVVFLDLKKLIIKIFFNKLYTFALNPKNVYRFKNYLCNCLQSITHLVLNRHIRNQPMVSCRAPFWGPCCSLCI